ncbi:MAG TPA: hypothetical protein VLA88_06215 [Candidatus Saccharimonadales bacterium]|nr:hypothetical protein [Candidatus Saccharimonadales bacterium]
MFRKLVSNLPYSPALVGQLGFYAKRLRKEQFSRRLGLIFTALALIVQSFAVFTPPEQALASSGSDVIPGGVRSVQDILSVYDAGAKGQNDFKDFMDYFGIKRANLAAMDTKYVYICSSDKNIVSFGRKQHYSAAEGTLVHNVPKQTGGFSTFYSVPLYRFDSVNHTTNCYDAFVGNAPSVGWFAIMRKCGNFQIKTSVQKLPKGHFVAATCKSVQGYAYDERQSDLKVKVYLYFNGPPGKGQQYGPIMSDQAAPTSPVGSSHGFSFAVPEQYQKSTKATTVWAVMQPLPGWNQPNVQFDNTVSIPGNCAPVQTPIAQCNELAIRYIDRTHISMTAKAHAEQGAKIAGYSFIVTDKNGQKVYEKTIATAAELASVDTAEIKLPGEYTAKVIAKTTIGDKESTDCTKTLTVSPPDKCKYNASILATDENCRPCPYDSGIWIKDEENCRPQISHSKEARNLTQNVATAASATAKASDRIEYTIYTTNVGSGTVTTPVSENLDDVLDYANLEMAGNGGSFDQVSHILSWGDVKLGPQQTDVRTFVVQVKSTIPSTPRAANNPAAYNCVMTNSYGNTIDINMDCPAPKAVESTVHQLPSTGAGENILFGATLLMVVTYFYARSRQMNKEIKLIRKDFNFGTI